MEDKLDELGRELRSVQQLRNSKQVNSSLVDGVSERVVELEGRIRELELVGDRSRDGFNQTESVELRGKLRELEEWV